MKQKGFTLVELLAVIIIIAMIALIIFPVVTKQITNSKEDLYQIQVQNIIKAAKDMVLDDATLLDSNHIVPTLISVEDLQSSTNKEGVSYLEEGTIKSPLDGTEMKGTVVITYDESTTTWNYEYQEKTKSELSSLVVSPAAKTIIAKQASILTNEQESGLFEDVSQNKYIFRGENPANFIKIDNNLWRIVSIDKDTYTMKVAKTTHKVKSVWSESTSETNFSFSNQNLKIFTYLNSDFYNTLKDSLKSLIVENSAWYGGGVSGNVLSVKEMRSSEEKTTTIHTNVGLLSVSDFAEATYKLACRKDFSLEICPITNYLVLSNLDTEYFLLNNKKDTSGIWALNNVGNLTIVSSNTQGYVIPVIYLKGSAQIEANGNGNADNPYVLKLN